MNLQLGKRYVRRDGEVTGPLENSGSKAFPFHCPLRVCSYTESGSYYADGEDNYDLISEYIEPEAVADAMLAARKERA